MAKLQGSWRTTVCGLTVIASVLTAVAGMTPMLPENWRPWLLLAGAVGSGIGTGIGLIVSRDNGVSTEQVKAAKKKTTPPAPTDTTP